jgi:hypothetical protein
MKPGEQKFVAIKGQLSGQMYQVLIQAQEQRRRGGCA